MKKKLRYFVCSAEITDDVNAYSGDSVKEAAKSISHVVGQALTEVAIRNSESVTLTISCKDMTDAEVAGLPLV